MSGIRTRYAARSTQHGQMCLCGRCRMRQEQAIGACSMTFHVVRKRNKWPGSRRTPQSRLPVLAAGCNKEHGHWLPCPKACCCKSSFCRVANACRAGSPFLFFVFCFLFCVLCFVFRVSCFVFRVSCFVFRALRLAAIAFARRGTRCEAFEQDLGREAAISLHARARAVPGRTSIRSSACQRLRPLRQWAARRRCRPVPTA